MESYQLERAIWTESDFKIMGWHDVTIWSMFANTEEYEYLLDMDYIFKWVNPEENETYFKFWVAPVTMVFENVHSVKLDIESAQGFIEIAELHMENPQLTPNKKFTEFTYKFECQEGIISMKATGYKMHVRQSPRLLQGQGFNLNDRGGISFGREINAI